MNFNIARLMVAAVAAGGAAGVSACAAETDPEPSSAAAATTNTPTLQALYAETAPSIDGVVDALWNRATSVRFNRDTSGNPTGPVTQVRAMWDKGALYVLWELEGARFNVDRSRPIAKEREELYNEDCVELFLTPDRAQPGRYFELELGPYGHFYDLAIDRSTAVRKEDAGWSSGLTVRTSQNLVKQTAIIEARFTAPPIVNALRAGASLPLGLFRIEGTKPNRQYLAWSPPMKRDFHVASAFGWLALKGR